MALTTASARGLSVLQARFTPSPSTSIPRTESPKRLCTVADGGLHKRSRQSRGIDPGLFGEVCDLGSGSGKVASGSSFLLTVEAGAFRRRRTRSARRSTRRWRFSCSSSVAQIRFPVGWSQSPPISSRSRSCSRIPAAFNSKYSRGSLLLALTQAKLVEVCPSQVRPVDRDNLGPALGEPVGDRGADDPGSYDRDLQRASTPVRIVSFVGVASRSKLQITPLIPRRAFGKRHKD